MKDKRGLGLGLFVVVVLLVACLILAGFATAHERLVKKILVQYTQLETRASALAGTDQAEAAQQALNSLRSVVRQGDFTRAKALLPEIEDKLARLEAKAEAAPPTSPTKAQPPTPAKGGGATEANPLAKQLKAEAKVLASKPELQSAFEKAASALADLSPQGQQALAGDLRGVLTLANKGDWAGARKRLAEIEAGLAAARRPKLNLSPQAKELMKQNPDFARLVAQLEQRLTALNSPTLPPAFTKRLPDLRKAVQAGDAAAASKVLRAVLAELPRPKVAPGKRPGQAGKRPSPKLMQDLNRFNQLIAQLARRGADMQPWVAKRNSIQGLLQKGDLQGALKQLASVLPAMEKAFAKLPQRQVQGPPRDLLQVLVRELDAIRKLDAKDYEAHKQELALQLLELAHGTPPAPQQAPKGETPRVQSPSPAQVKLHDVVIFSTEVTAANHAQLLQRPLEVANAYATNLGALKLSLEGVSGDLATIPVKVVWLSGKRRQEKTFTIALEKGKGAFTWPDRLPGLAWPSKLVEISLPESAEKATFKVTKSVGTPPPPGPLLSHLPLPLRVLEFLQHVLPEKSGESVAAGLSRDHRHVCEAGASPLRDAQVGRSLLTLAALAKGAFPAQQVQATAKLGLQLLSEPEPLRPAFATLAALARCKLKASTLPDATDQLKQQARALAEEVHAKVRLESDSILTLSSTTLAVAAQDLLLLEAQRPGAAQTALPLLQTLEARLDTSTGLVREQGEDQSVLYTCAGQAETALAFAKASAKLGPAYGEKAFELLKTTLEGPAFKDAERGGYFSRNPHPFNQKTLSDQAALLLAVRALKQAEAARAKPDAARLQQLERWEKTLVEVLSQRFYDATWNGAPLVSDARFVPVTDSPCGFANTEAMCDLLLALVQL